MLAAYRKQSGAAAARGPGASPASPAPPRQEPRPPAAFASQLSVPLLAQGRLVGMLSLFSAAAGRLLRGRTASCWTCWPTRRPTPSSPCAPPRRSPAAASSGWSSPWPTACCSPTRRTTSWCINPAARRLLQLGDDPRATWTATHARRRRSGFHPFELVRGWEYGGSQVLREELKLFERTLQSTVTPVVDARGIAARRVRGAARRHRAEAAGGAQGRVRLHGQPRAAHAAHLHLRRAGPGAQLPGRRHQREAAAATCRWRGLDREAQRASSTTCWTCPSSPRAGCG